MVLIPDTIGRSRIRYLHRVSLPGSQQKPRLATVIRINLLVEQASLYRGPMGGLGIFRAHIVGSTRSTAPAYHRSLETEGNVGQHPAQGVDAWPSRPLFSNRRRPWDRPSRNWPGDRRPGKSPVSSAVRICGVIPATPESWLVVCEQSGVGANRCSPLTSAASLLEFAVAQSHIWRPPADRRSPAGQLGGPRGCSGRVCHCLGWRRCSSENPPSPGGSRRCWVHVLALQLGADLHLVLAGRSSAR